MPELLFQRLTQINEGKGEAGYGAEKEKNERVSGGQEERSCYCTWKMKEKE